MTVLGDLYKQSGSNHSQLLRFPEAWARKAQVLTGSRKGCAWPTVQTKRWHSPKGTVQLMGSEILYLGEEKGENLFSECGTESGVGGGRLCYNKTNLEL